MRVDRRTMLRGMSLGAGAVLLSPILRELEAHAAGSAERPKRFVFMLQSQGLQSWAVRPKEVVRKDTIGVDRVVSRPISELTLAEDCAPLARYQDRLTIVQGLNGHHVYPYHGGPYGALGGFLKGQTPIGLTIDCALARAVPSVFSLVGLGIGQYVNTTYC